MSYVRDNQGIIINTDDSHYKAIVAQRSAQKQAEAACSKMKEIEADLTVIKKLLQQVIKNRD
jgi:DNA-binding transcriptional regulator YhcF (GntR family)